MMKNKTSYWSSLLILIILSSCSSQHKHSGLTAKESRMSEELLRSQVLRYKAEAEKDLAEMAKFFDQYAPLDSPFTPEMAAVISTALAALAENREMRGTMFDYSLSLDRYFLFYDKLKEKGGDMTGLEIDFDTPIQEKYYSPPIKEPQVPEASLLSMNRRKSIVLRKSQFLSTFCHYLVQKMQITEAQPRHYLARNALLQNVFGRNRI